MWRLERQSMVANFSIQQSDLEFKFDAFLVDGKRTSRSKLGKLLV